MHNQLIRLRWVLSSNQYKYEHNNKESTYCKSMRLDNYHHVVQIVFSPLSNIVKIPQWYANMKIIFISEEKCRFVVVHFNLFSSSANILFDFTHHTELLPRPLCAYRYFSLYSRERPVFNVLLFFWSFVDNKNILITTIPKGNHIQVFLLRENYCSISRSSWWKEIQEMHTDDNWACCWWLSINSIII